MAIADRELEQPLEHEIDPQIQTELLKYPGKWVAFTRSEIVAVADEAADAWEGARAKGVASPILYRVPEGVTAYFF